jgi:hypothetical protein
MRFYRDKVQVGGRMLKTNDSLHAEILLEYGNSEFTDKVERNCHFLAPCWNSMTHRQALQGFPDTSNV